MQKDNLSCYSLFALLAFSFDITTLPIVCTSDSQDRDSDIWDNCQVAIVYNSNEVDKGNGDILRN